MVRGEGNKCRRRWMVGSRMWEVVERMMDDG